MLSRSQATSAWCRACGKSGKRAFSGVRGLPLGNARFRHRRRMPTLVAVQINRWSLAHYERPLAAGKRSKVARVACMLKLLASIYSIARNRRPPVPCLALRSDDWLKT